MMDGNERLKPCPFCGGKAKRIDIDATEPSIHDAGGSYIACERCYACSPIMFGEKTGLEESWNLRAVSTIDHDAIRRECADKAKLAILSAPSDIVTRAYAASLAEEVIVFAESPQDDGKPEAKP